MDKRAGAIGPREVRAPLEAPRPFAVSQCLRCVGCRFVAGRHDQVYMRCERTAQRYPRQPQLRCESFQGLIHATLSLRFGEQKSEQEGEQRPFTWRLSTLSAPLSFTLGAPLDLTASPLSEALSGASLEPSLAPPSALILEPLERSDDVVTSARLLWSATPQRGLCLGWSDALLSLPLGSDLTLTTSS